MGALEIDSRSSPFSFSAFCLLLTALGGHGDGGSGSSTSLGIPMLWSCLIFLMIYLGWIIMLSSSSGGFKLGDIGITLSHNLSNNASKRLVLPFGWEYWLNSVNCCCKSSFSS